MKILLLEDHRFFGDELEEYFRIDLGAQVCYAHNYEEAVGMINTATEAYDFSFLDILLQNGKTGIDIVSKYEARLGKIMFITGCIDQATLQRIEKYCSASKSEVIWPKIEKFMAGEKVSLSASYFASDLAQFEAMSA